MKVFLVEDEFIIREGIKNNIDWESNGYTFCGEAGDGELALPLISKEQPDIVITDIKMPFMDGLELSRLIKEKYPKIEIIILSGYDEFEYAKQGIRIGVAQYLLKPISGVDLLKAVNEVRDRLQDKQKERALYERYRRETEENRLNDKIEFFNDLVNGNDSLSEMMTRAKALDIDITAVWYNVVLFKARSMNHEIEEYSGSVEKVYEKLDSIIEGRKILSFDRGLEGKALIYMADTLEELEKEENEVMSGLEDYMSTYSQIMYFGGVGSPVNRLREISASFDSAARAFAHRYLVEKNRIISCEDIKSLAKAADYNFSLSSVDPKQIDNGKIVSFLKTGDAQETKYFIEEYFNELGNAAKSQIFRQYIVMNIYFAVSEFMNSIGADKDQVDEISTVENQTTNLTDTITYLTKLMMKAISLRDLKASDKAGSLVDTVKEIVKDNYSDSELSLGMIASKVNFSPNHLSMLFSHETGQTLIKYLTDYRLNKAKELLKCTNLKSSEISEKVGYLDPHYFSYLFKKTYGVTPTMYREGKDIN